jgi:hypothetical protein
MTESELWGTVVKCAAKALETMDDAPPSRRDAKIVAARTMILFTPESERSQSAARPWIRRLLSRA